MNVLQTEWWSIAIAPEWWTEREEDGVVIGDRDEVGSIQISTLRKDEGEFLAPEVAQIALENAEVNCDWETAAMGDFSGVATCWLEEDSAIREWYLAAGPVLLYVTYSCDLEHAGMDDAAVDEILDTLEVIPH